jgi:hypothetical protein
MPMNFFMWTFVVWSRFANQLAVATINRALQLFLRLKKLIDTIVGTSSTIPVAELAS